MAELKRKSFALKESVLRPAYTMPNDERDKFLLSVIHYMAIDEEPNLTEYPLAKNAFDIMRDFLIKEKTKIDTAIKNGKKGAHPKKTKTHEKTRYNKHRPMFCRMASVGRQSM